MHRRRFLQTAAASAIAAGLGPGFWRAAYADPAVIGDGPYGPLKAADANGVLLPDGFASRIVATRGETVPGPSGYVWHANPDGGAVFAQPDGSFVYTSNSESNPGGTGALKFDAEGTLVDGYRILDGTRNNCAGGATPWGTWLSCEESPGGMVWECDVTGPGNGIRRVAMGAGNYEAVGTDPVRKRMFITEDLPAAPLRRFTPAVWSDDGVGTLDAGLLEYLSVDGDTGAGTGPWPIAWTAAANGATPTLFNGGEGCWYDAGSVYFTTKGDNRVWRIDVVAQTLEVIYDDDLVPADSGVEGRPVLRGVDNVTVSPGGELFVAEDGGNLELVLITLTDTERIVTPFLRLEGHSGSEIAGPAFHPVGDRLFFSSQRGPDGGPGGQTFEITGPFTTPVPDAVVPEFDPMMAAGLTGAVAAGAYALSRRRERVANGDV